MKIVKHLPVRLTEEERKVKAGELAKQLAEYDDLEKEKKAATSGLTAQMKALRAQYTETRRIVATGIEEREVECFRDVNLPLKVWEVRRSDTGDVVSQDAMTQREIDEQMQLDFTREGGQAPVNEKGEARGS